MKILIVAILMAWQQQPKPKKPTVKKHHMIPQAKKVRKIPYFY